MSIASIIIPTGQPFTIAKFKQYATGANLRQIFSRLVKSGVVQRITSDIYAKPEGQRMVFSKNKNIVMKVIHRTYTYTLFKNISNLCKMRCIKYIHWLMKVKSCNFFGIV